MIDLHCHILPGIDDGALDLADSVAMAREAEQDGIAVVCATPHIRHDHDVRIAELPSRVSQLQAELDSSRVAVRIASGGELAERSVPAISEQELAGVSLDGNGWVLLEPAPGPLGDGILASVRTLANRGHGVVVAHPERHAGPDLLSRLHALADAGCLIQWTAAFVAASSSGGYEGLLQTLAEEGLVHLLASDAHSSHAGRPLRLSDGVARLQDLLSPDEVSWIVETAPAAVLRGELVERPA
jgi:protein-tyrosine phosphatase